MNYSTPSTIKNHVLVQYLPTKIMFWCKKWLEYLDKPMSISIFAPTNIFTARRQQILDTLWKWEKHGKTDSQHS